jgi:phosphopentomutase
MATDAGGLILANLVDFDMLYGHRNNPRGYADALEEFDVRLPEIQAALREDDVLMLTADHGNDPTTPSTDHSRERVPILVSGPQVRRATDLGTRDNFADVAASIADLLGVAWGGAGTSFARAIVSR